jgi:uncharacterized protein YbjT (DUF2867 family)
VLVCGAAGFVGRALCPALEGAGHAVTRGARPAFDVDREESVREALIDQEAAVWLVHGLQRRGAYAAWEQDVAARFGRLARQAGVGRILYLGGLEPRGALSRHLRSRLATGEALRAGGVDVVELRAGMIVGAGSESWTIARDAAARLPRFLAPPWLAARQQPVAIDDVVAALGAALALPAGIYDVPGPDTLSGADIVERTARLLGRSPRFTAIPMFPRRLAGALAPVVTRARGRVSRELFRGMGLDFVVEGDGVFAHLPGHRRLGFDEAAARALALDEVPLPAQLYEGLLRRAQGGLAR